MDTTRYSPIDNLKAKFVEVFAKSKYDIGKASIFHNINTLKGKSNEEEKFNEIEILQ